MKEKKIWTIGHSTRPIEEFVQLLKISNIQVLVDVRQYPGSKREPQFNRTELKASLKNDGIDYINVLLLEEEEKQNLIH